MKGAGKRAPVPGVEEAIDSLDAAARQRIETLEAEIRALGRAGTDQIFTLGEHLDTAAAILKDETFTQWVKTRFDMTDRHARTIRNVHRHLGHVRAACVRHEIKPTVLYHLVAADRSVVDAVVASFERGERLKVREVRALVDGVAGDGEDGGDEAAAAPGDRGGLKGLKGLAASKQARQIKSVRAALAVIGREVEAALEPASRGKRVLKGKLADAVMATARLAERELIELILDIEVDSLAGSQNLRHVRLPETRWQDVLSMLGTLAGGAESLPRNGELTPWLTDEVLPLVAFALEGEDGKPSAAAVSAAAGADIDADPDEDAETDEAPATDAAAEAGPEGRAIRRRDADAGEVDGTQPDADEFSDPVAASVATPVLGSAA
ncbi:hypothetical protein [Aurantimonas sp. 22II-16-19i]|uniref:hypothetical protein n=1 Tax=Aurantimonas sp. 22II-16-19i TaxID=1317114 RepID=UPI0009F7F17A|nr:hypothetical protein [Aurantimonas sp. 22II-16-19i]ORE88167.1 hypothetical protein ATO4_24517 [Aurantimonas sp. 22II-16-19i]